MKISKLLLLGMLVVTLGVPNLAVAEYPTDCIGGGIQLKLFRSPTSAHVGDTITYWISAAVDDFPPNCAIDDVTLSWIAPDGTPEVLIGPPGVDLDPSQETTVFTRTYVVDAADLLPDDTIQASATAEGIVLDGPPNSNTDDYDEISVLIVSNPNTLATITADPVVGVAPYPSTLTITEKNTGDDPLTNVYVQLIDLAGPTLLDTLTDPPDSGDPVTPGTQGVLDVGETWTWIYPVTVTGPITYEVRGFGTDPLGEEVTYPTYPDEKDVVDLDAITPAIEIIKDGPDYGKSEGPWGDGDVIQYSAVINNIGTEDLVIVSIDDDVFGNIAVLDGYPLVAGDSVLVSYGYMPQPTDPDPLVNVVTVVASYDVGGVTGTVTDDDDHSVDLVHPDFTVDKICLNDPVPEGEDAQFEITITNIGDIPLIITSDELELAGPLDLVIGQPIVQVVTRPIDDVVINTIIVVATLPAEFDLDNVIERSDTAECGTQGDTFCSFTQGFYGNEGGKACGGMTTREIIDEVLGDGV